MTNKHSTTISSGRSADPTTTYWGRRGGRVVLLMSIFALSAAAEPGTPAERLTVKQEIKAIDDAMTHSNENFLARYGGFGGAMKRSAALQTLPQAKLTEGVSIDDYSTWRAVRFAEQDEIG